MLGNNYIITFLQELDHRTNQPMLLTGALLVVTTNTIFLKNRMYFNIYLEKRLKHKVHEVGLLPRYFYGIIQLVS